MIASEHVGTVDLGSGIVGHLLHWELHERDGTWWAWVSWIQQTGGRHVHKVVLVIGAGGCSLWTPRRPMRTCHGG
jgi:hypothetical protein